ncbi:prepilin peptidase [Vibrio cincinnatiensis]|uniref:prepilin peptidase n=2 Tax=Vibrio TaxID=662 RepID=UPI000C1739D0|nr:prepilin peptidase [Vibrio fujianensis]MCG3736047.1 prepilin peptidase [Vibrio cincinnatiensis]
MKILYLLLMTLILFIVCKSDIASRSIRNQYFIYLGGLLLLGWLTQPNWSVLPYTLAILLIGLVLFYFQLLAAGDTKLLAVLSLGIHPDYLPLTIVGITVIGGIMALGYLLYGLCTDLTAVRQKGIPYGVPISLVGGFAIYLSSL